MAQYPFSNNTGMPKVAKMPKINVSYLYKLPDEELFLQPRQFQESIEFFHLVQGKIEMNLNFHPIFILYLALPELKAGLLWLNLAVA